MKRFLLVILFYNLFFTSLTIARDWETIKKSGVLKVGLRKSSSLIYHPVDTKNRGMMYDMADDFAKAHNLKTEFIVIPSFSQYWLSNGKMLNKTNDIATPDIYQDIDIAAEVFTVTKRREELIHMSPYIDNVELLFGTHGTKIKGYKDLIGKRLLSYEGMSFYNILKTEMDKQQIPYKVIYVKSIDGELIVPKSHKDSKDKVNFYNFPSNSQLDGTSVYHYVAGGFADVGINDGISVIVRLFSNNYYRENLRPLFPAQKNMTQLAWGSEKDNTLLNEKIQLFMKKDKENGNFSQRLNKYVGMTLEEYNQLINLIE